MTSQQSSNGNAMACHHHRSAAIVCNDGMTTLYASYTPIPADILALIEQGRDEEANPLLATMIKDDTNARWGLTNGVWVNGGRKLRRPVARQGGSRRAARWSPRGSVRSGYQYRAMIAKSPASTVQSLGRSTTGVR
jgi:hypothetical protein